MEEPLPNMVDDRVKEHTKTEVPLYNVEGLILERKQNQADVAKMIADAIQQECENLRAEITSQIINAIANHIPSQVDSSVRNYMLDNPQLQHDDLPIWLALKIKFKGLHASNTSCRSSVIRPRDQDDPHDDAHPEGENSAKRQKTSEHGTYVFGESSSRQANESEPGPSTLGDEHQYHIDQMKNFLKNDIVWKSRKEILSLPFPQKPTLVVQSCQRDPKAPALSLINQDLLYLKKGNSGPEKFMLSLHKFHGVIFSDDDIEERTSRWTKRTRKVKRRSLLKSKIVQVIKTYGKLGHEHKFVTEIIARRANGSIVSIIEPDYKNLNKNDIKDMYFLCINGKVSDYAETGLLWSLSVFIRCTVIWERVHDFQLGMESYQQKVNLTAPIITFLGIKKHKMFSIISKPVYGIIYKNNKKEKRVMRHQEVHKFCDATLKSVLKRLKNYNNDVKHGYVTPSLSKEDAEYLQFFEEEIKEPCSDSRPLRWRLLPCLCLPSFYLLSCALCLWGSYVPRVPGLGHLPILAEIGLAASRCGSLSPHASLWERRALIMIFPASFGSSSSKPLNRTSTNTSLVRCSKVIKANLLSCLALKIPFIWLAISWESVKMARLLISISRATHNPASNASYSTLLFVVLNSKRRAYVYSLTSGLINIGPTPEPLDLDTPLRASLASVVYGMVFLSVQLLSALKKWNDFSAPFDKKRLSVASFPLRLCISLSVLGGSRSVTAVTFNGLAVVPCFVMKCFLDILEHVLLGGGLYHHVIDVSFEISSDMITKDLVHQPLIGGPCIL
ncbi:hypothetical protein Tco_0687011 [Tanacetum coccineum]